MLLAKLLCQQLCCVFCLLWCRWCDKIVIEWICFMIVVPFSWVNLMTSMLWPWSRTAEIEANIYFQRLCQLATHIFIYIEFIWIYIASAAQVNTHFICYISSFSRKKKLIIHGIITSSRLSDTNELLWTFPAVNLLL